MRACHNQTDSVETRQAVHMAQSQQLSIKALYIQSAAMSATEKSALLADSNRMSYGSIADECTWEGACINDVLDTVFKSHLLRHSLDHSLYKNAFLI